MGAEEFIASEIKTLPQPMLARVVEYINFLKADKEENNLPMHLAESALAKDWLTPEEDEAWKNL